MANLILKRGTFGTFYYIVLQHLHHYLAEFDFRYSDRSASNLDEARTFLAMRGIVEI